VTEVLVVQTQDTPVVVSSSLGQVIFSVDGVRFTVEDPITSAEGWLVNSEGVLLVEG
jgi:hypothetical protein